MKLFLLHPVTLSALGIATLPLVIIAALALFATCAVCEPVESFIERKGRP